MEEDRNEKKREDVSYILYNILVYYYILYFKTIIYSNNLFKATTTKVKAGNSTTLTQPIYYISSNEGIASHMKQLEIVWNIANSVNRPLEIIPFENKEHYN